MAGAWRAVGRSRSVEACALLAFGVAASVSFAATWGTSALTPKEASAISSRILAAIQAEHQAAHLIFMDPREARLKLEASHDDLVDASRLLATTSSNPPGIREIGLAEKTDVRAEREVPPSYGADVKKRRQEALADIALAIKQKHQALLEIQAAVTTPPTPTPTVGPLGACVFITNNGSTTTENVKVSDPGGADLTGSVLFSGQGLNTTNQIHLDANGGAVSPFTVNIFGMSSITITVTDANGQLQTLTIPFTLDQSNDVTISDCTTHQ